MFQQSKSVSKSTSARGGAASLTSDLIAALTEIARIDPAACRELLAYGRGMIRNRRRREARARTRAVRA